MVKTIFNRITEVAASLDKATPARWARITDLHNTQKIMMYAVTITYKKNYSITVTKMRQPTFKHEGKMGLKTLYDQQIVIYKQERFNQITLTGDQLVQAFEGMEYIFYPEFTKNGMIHWHGLMYHPLMPACGIVEDSIIKVCNRFGKQNDVKKVNDIEAWYDYITKEGRPPIATKTFDPKI